MTKAVSAKLFILTVAMLTLWSNVAFSGDYYWVNGSGDWNDGGHWSTSSGGTATGSIPDNHDHVIFDELSFTSDFSLVHITEHVSIQSMDIDSKEYISFHGSDINLTLGGDLNMKSNAGFYLGGKLILKNKNPLPATLKTNGNDFYTDLYFEQGEWQLDGHLKTGKNYSIHFNSGIFKSRGYTVHARAIYANHSAIDLDFTASHISVLDNFFVPKAENIGGRGTYLVLCDSVNPEDLKEFTRDGDLTKDATVFCTTPPFELNLFITSDYNGEHISCFDSCDGEITVVASGTPGPFSYRLGPDPSPFGASNVFSDLCVGSHSVTVTDSSNELAPGLFDICTISDDLNEPPVLSFDTPVTINPTCPDVCDGQAFSFPTGGTSPLVIFWPVSGETTPNPTMLCVGDNPVVITDINGCTISDTVIISEPIQIIANPDITPPTCNGDCDAIILVNPAGGNGAPYTFNWVPAPASGAASNPGDGFCSGDISLTITDADGCSFDTTITIIDPPIMTITIDDIVDASCNGGCDGQATANPVGGVPAYTYEWFDAGTGLTTGITDQTATGLCAGDYFVIVTDALGCQLTSPTITISEPPPFVMTVDVYSVSCFGVCDGAADVDITGGTPPYTFSWTTFPGGIGVGATDSISGLCPGEYQIIVTDDNGCESVAIVVEVLEPSEVTVTVSGTDPTCFDLCDGTALAVGAGGTPPYTYSWSPLPGTGGDTDSPSDMCADTYTVTVTDDNGCTGENTITLDSPEEYDIDVIITDLDCFGDTDGAIDITINSGGSGFGYTFTWVPTPPVGDGTANVSGLTAGTWTVTIADSEGCDTTMSFDITSPPELLLDANVISDVLCNGDCDGSADVVITGGTAPYTILWDDPLAQTTLLASDLCAGTYTVTVTDDNGCVASASITIAEPADFDLTLSQVDLLCFGDCDGTATVLVNSGGVAPYTILWDDPLAQTTFTAVGLCAGTYIAVITDNNGCDTTVTFVLSEPEELIIDIELINGTCFGDCTGSAHVTISGGTTPYTFEWFDAATDIALGVDNDTIFDLCAGDYYCIVTDDNGCTAQSDDIEITEFPEIFPSIVSTTDATCAICDGEAVITATGGAGGFVYDWEPDPLTGDGTPSVTGLCSGTYTVTITDAAGCIESIVVSIDDIALEVLELDSIDVSCFGLCDGQAIATFVELDGPYVIEWFDNITGLTTGIFGSPATGLCAGEYLAVLTNASGCVTTEVIVINEPEEIFGVITTTDVTCEGLCDGTASVVVSGGILPYTYDWGVPLPGGGEGTPNAIGLCAGPWEVVVTDGAGCIVTFTTTINEDPAVTIDAESSTGVSCFGDTDGTASVIASGGTPPYTYEWFDCATGLPIGQTDALATGLPPGSYECVVTDDNGCTVTSSCIPVDDAPEITAIINTETISCYGDCDGLIWVVPGGGDGTYFFQWLDEFGLPIIGQTNDSLENLCIGTYNLEITDLSGCVQIIGPIDMTSPASPWIVVTSQTNISCAGDCDGTATVVVLDGNNPPYTYLWDDPLVQVTPTANFLCEGTWTVTISDAGVCDTTISFDIIDNDPIFANMTDLTDVLCFGECTGEVTVDPFGGTAPYTLNWSDGQTGNTASDLCAGPITLTITDALGCSIDTTFTLNESPEIVSTSTFSNNATCGECNGSATVNVEGGVEPYTYDWTPDPLGGDGTNNATGLCPGVVSVLITDDNGCTITEVFAISDLSGEDVTVTSTDATCFGLCDGTAEATYVCSDPPCTQEWYDALTGLTTGITTSIITDLCPGEYFVEVINGSGCVTIENVIIGSPPEIFAGEVITQITCSGDSDGTIILTPTGGSGGGYTYSWSPVPPNGDGTNEALDLGPGTWTVTITDSDGCEQTLNFNLADPEPIILTVDPTNVTCNGLCNGTISATASGGAGGFTFQWYMDGILMPGEVSPLLAGICPGNYNVEVTDANGCVVTLPADVTISEPIAITAPITSTNVTCFGFCDGTATVVVGGGAPPYVVVWYDAITDALIGITGTEATDLCPGSYYAVITDANGCSLISSTVIITEPAELTFTLSTTDASCFGFCDGTGDIVVIGGTPTYTFEWLTIGGVPVVGGTGASVVDLCEGNYTVEVVDANGCTTGLLPVVIDGFSEIIGSIFSNDATCSIADGNATVFASGGNPPFTYQWFDAGMVALPGEIDMTLLDVFSGIYFVTVTDANGCSETFMATISDIGGPDVVFDEINHPTCFGSCDGSILITASGENPPFTYVWNPDGIIAEDPTGLCAGDYIIEVTDALGCVTFEDTTLVDPAEIIATAIITPTECGLCNGAIDLTVMGGTGALTVVWNTGATGLTLTDLCSGAYEAEITDENGCSVIQPFIVGNSEGLIGDAIVIAITCAESCDGAVVVTGLGGTAPYTYLWLHDLSTSNTLTGLCAGSYFVEITDDVGCITTLEVEMFDPAPIDATATISNPLCGLSDGSINVMSSGGVLPHTYLWDTGATTSAITGLDAGIYVLTITDDNGCSIDFTYTLNNLSAVVIELTTTDIDCNGICNGTIDTLSLTGGNPAFTFEWLDELGIPLGTTTPLITDLCAGDYILEVTDAAGCISYQSATINEPDTILVNPLFAQNPICFGDCDGFIVANPIGGTLPFTFIWDDPAVQTTAAATDLCAGTYTVTMTDANGCEVMQTGTLTEPDELLITLDSLNDATCQDAADGAIFITVLGGTPDYTYEWISETLIDTFTVEDPSDLLPMTYYLTITDENGCIYMDTLTIDTLISIIAYAGPDTLICNNTDLILFGSSNILDGATYTWFDTLGNILSDSSALVLNGNEAGTEYYILEVFYMGCTDYDTVIVTTASPIFVDAGPDIELYATQSGTIGGSPTTDIDNSVIWDPTIYLNDPFIDNPTVITPEISTWYYVTATDSNGCTNIDSVYVKVLPEIVIPDGITPGSDGKNDTWILDFIDQYPGVSIKINIYNRWGDLLYESDETYNDDWAGTTEDGKRLPAGTYYFVIDVDHEDFPDPITGPLTVMW
ncbi:MAG: gliding motility-associated-like protein [Crocinitomix sp.]|jgi:gliding motility-associated-like protein